MYMWIHGCAPVLITQTALLSVFLLLICFQTEFGAVNYIKSESMGSRQQCGLLCVCVLFQYKLLAQL